MICKYLVILVAIHLISSLVHCVKQPLSLHVFLVNTLSLQYLLSNERMTVFKNFCIVFLSILVARDKLVSHISLKSHAVTSVWRYEIWKVLRYGTSDVTISISSFLKSVRTFSSPSSMQFYYSYLIVYWIVMKNKSSELTRLD